MRNKKVEDYLFRRMWNSSRVINADVYWKFISHWMDGKRLQVELYMNLISFSYHAYVISGNKRVYELKNPPEQLIYEFNVCHVMIDKYQTAIEHFKISSKYNKHTRPIDLSKL